MLICLCINNFNRLHALPDIDIYYALILTNAAYLFKEYNLNLSFIAKTFFG